MRLVLIFLEIPVTIYTQNHRLIYDLLGESRVNLGIRKKLTDDLTVRYDNAKIRTTFGLAEMVQITLIVAEDITERVAAELIAGWLFQKLSTNEAQVTKLKIGNVAVELDENTIKNVVFFL